MKRKSAKRGRPRKRKTRKTGKNDTSTAWERLPKTPAGKQVKIQFYVDAEQIPRLKRAGKIAVEMEKMTKGSGIIRNTPGMYCKYCCEMGATSLEKILEMAMKQGRNNAIASNTHHS